MSYARMEAVINKSKSVYKIVSIAAQRAQELSQGSPALVEAAEDKVATIALREMAAGKVTYKLRSEGETTKKKKKPTAKSKSE